MRKLKASELVSQVLPNCSRSIETSIPPSSIARVLSGSKGDTRGLRLVPRTRDTKTFSDDSLELENIDCNDSGDGVIPQVVGPKYTHHFRVQKERKGNGINANDLSSASTRLVCFICWFFNLNCMSAWALVRAHFSIGITFAIKLITY